MVTKCVRRTKVQKKEEPFLTEQKVLAVFFPEGICAQAVVWAAMDRLYQGQKKSEFSMATCIDRIGWILEEPQTHDQSSL